MDICISAPHCLYNCLSSCRHLQHTLPLTMQVPQCIPAAEMGLHVAIRAIRACPPCGAPASRQWEKRALLPHQVRSPFLVPSRFLLFRLLQKWATLFSRFGSRVFDKDFHSLHIMQIRLSPRHSLVFLACGLFPGRKRCPGSSGVYLRLLRIICQEIQLALLFLQS